MPRCQDPGRGASPAADADGARTCRAGGRPTDRTAVALGVAWAAARNDETATVRWQFTTEDARIKLKRLYPVPEPRK
ncbi:MAG: hypothetical protein M3Q10_14845 [Chloroflexota bacterium]|nr:hypothetical protein [Chloroflexota bacterium]